MLVILYEAALRTGRVPPGHGVGQFQRNVVQAETFVFNDASRQGLSVVGSSITANFMWAFEKVRPADNLAMGGESSLTGLAFVVDSPEGVKRVVVELSHALTVAKDPKLTGMAEAPFTSSAVRNVWSLRQEYQPANVLSRFLARSTGGADEAPGVGTLPDAIRGPIIADVVKLFSSPPSETEAKAYGENLRTLHAEIDAAYGKGIQCELFWPPIDDALNQSLREQAFFAMARREFPPSRYRWLDVGYTGPTRTNDGHHLISEDAEAYGRALAIAVGP